MIRVPRALIEWFDLRRAIAAIVVIGGGYALLVWRVYASGGPPWGVLAAAPVVAIVLAPPLIALFPAYVGWIQRRTMAPWQGRYYAFDDHQIRIVEARGQLWFATADVHAALGLRHRPAVIARYASSERRPIAEIGEGLSLAGLARLLARSTDARALRFLQWAERDVAKPWQNKRELQKMRSTAGAAVRTPPP